MNGKNSRILCSTILIYGDKSESTLPIRITDNIIGKEEE